MSNRDIALDVLSQVSGRARDSITPEMELVTDLGIDSARALELLIELEEKLDREIGDDAATSINTVADLLAFAEGA